MIQARPRPHLHDRAPRVVATTLLAACALACGGPGDTVEIQGRRTASSPSIRVLGGVSSAQRFGGSMTGHGAAPAADAGASEPAPLAFSLPAGWQELAGSSLRPINLRPAGHPDAECYVTLLAGDGGGMVANLDRWRKQLGLDPLQPGEVDELPELAMLGGTAKLIDIEGAYSGMGDDARAGWALVGAVLLQPGAAVFVKMTGPADVVQAEREAFLAFCSSLREPGAGAASASAPGSGAPGAAGPVGSAGPLAWKVPAGWRVGEPRSMRLVSFDIGQASECYVTLLRGDGGGLVANLDRWRSELGLEATTPDEVAAMQRLPALGVESVLFEGVGTYSSMGGAPREDQKVLGAICLRGDDSVFVKMIGPREEVTARRDEFLAFVTSLEEVAR